MTGSPLFKSRETRFTNGTTVARLVLLQQPVADQQRDTTLADLDRRDHDHAPGAALTEASCTGGGCWFVVHVTSCYYVINIEFCTTLGQAPCRCHARDIATLHAPRSEGPYEPYST